MDTEAFKCNANASYPASASKYLYLLSGKKFTKPFIQVIYSYDDHSAFNVKYINIFEKYVLPPITTKEEVVNWNN